MEEKRTTNTPAGPVTYHFTCKRVFNWNLRVRGDQVYLSAPFGTTGEQADAHIRRRWDWIAQALERQRGAQPIREELSREQCQAQLGGAVDRMLPLAARIGVKGRPALRLRRMKSQWGNCHYRQGYITLNTALASCPEELQDYVALHELVHFIHPNHGPGFYAAMTALMPDWQRRRQELNKYLL